jgi:hypothetical protein
MFRKNFAVKFLALAVGLGVGGHASAAIYTGNSTTDPHSWNDANNWSPIGVPSHSDSIEIGSTFTVNFDVTSSLDIGVFNIDGTLNIPAGKILNVSAASGTHNLDGVIVLQGANSIVRFSNYDQTLAGDGSIRGEHGDARLELGINTALACKIKIEGALVIDCANAQYTATLNLTDDTGRVVANRINGQLTLGANLSLGTDDTNSTPTLEAVASGATLQFERAHAYPIGDLPIRGDIILSHCGATIVFAVSMQTEGTFTDGNGGEPNGYIDFKDGSEFCWEMDSTPQCEDTDGLLGICP